MCESSVFSCTAVVERTNNFTEKKQCSLCTCALVTQWTDTESALTSHCWCRKHRKIKRVICFHFSHRLFLCLFIFLILEVRPVSCIGYRKGLGMPYVDDNLRSTKMHVCINSWYFECCFAQTGLSFRSFRLESEVILAILYLLKELFEG